MHLSRIGEKKDHLKNLMECILRNFWTMFLVTSHKKIIQKKINRFSCKTQLRLDIRTCTLSQTPTYSMSHTHSLISFVLFWKYVGEGSQDQINTLNNNWRQQCSLSQNVLSFYKTILQTTYAFISLSLSLSHTNTHPHANSSGLTHTGVISWRHGHFPTAIFSCG